MFNGLLLATSKGRKNTNKHELAKKKKSQAQYAVDDTNDNDDTDADDDVAVAVDFCVCSGSFERITLDWHIASARHSIVSSIYH